jgi:hypothetical protein
LLKKSSKISPYFSKSVDLLIFFSLYFFDWSLLLDFKAVKHHFILIFGLLEKEPSSFVTMPLRYWNTATERTTAVCIVNLSTQLLRELDAMNSSEFIDVRSRQSTGSSKCQATLEVIL